MASIPRTTTATQEGAVDRLLTATHELVQTHYEHETAYAAWSELHHQREEIERSYRAQIAAKLDPATGKPLYTNETKREAALYDVMERSHGDLLADLASAESLKRSAAAAYERLHEEVRTLRVVVAHETATIEYETAQASMPRLLTGTRHQRHSH
jgi:hypothetical protein